MLFFQVFSPLKAMRGEQVGEGEGRRQQVFTQQSSIKNENKTRKLNPHRSRNIYA